MNTRLLTTLGLLLTCFAPGTARAWNDSGHMLIATIGYNGLTPAEKAQVDAILQHHPKYSDWSAAYPSGSPVSRGLFVFMQASTWADDVRNYDDPATHANWHFIDYPLRPPRYSFRAAFAPNDNAVFGIRALRRSLDDAHQSRRAQAEQLAFLVHFVGDIHQPLHCATLINPTFPDPDEGDRGGNYFRVKMQSNSANSVKLHTLWDGMVGSGIDPENLSARAAVVVNTHPRTQFPTELAKIDPRDWSLESRTHAITSVYKPLPSLDGTLAHPVVLPPDYHQNGRKLSTNCVAIAGYRLTDTVKAILAGRADDH